MLVVARGAGTLARDIVFCPQHVQQVGALQSGSMVSAALLVDQEREGYAGLLTKHVGVRCVAKADRRKIKAAIAELLLVCAQLRDMLTAENSTVVPKEDHGSGLVLPKRTETDFGTAGVRQDDWRQCFGKHH